MLEMKRPRMWWHSGPKFTYVGAYLASGAATQLSMLPPNQEESI